MSFKAITCKIFASNQTYLGYLGEATFHSRGILQNLNEKVVATFLNNTCEF